MSLATMVSPSPMPMISGESLRAATMVVGVVEVHDGERVRALEVLDRARDGGRQIAVEVALDEMRDGLGVGLGAQDVAVGRELLAQLDVVLDDAVVHDRDLAGAVDVRMRVLLARLAVRRPARVADADAARRPARRRARS